MTDTLLQSLFYILPAAVTGYVAYYMFNSVIKQQHANKKIELLLQNKKESLPIKLKAYERLLLFCERINPVKIIMRVTPISDAKNDYLNLLIANIEQELEHNLIQQIYVSNTCWTAINLAKNNVLQKFKDVAENSNSAQDFRENILIDYSKTLPPTETAKHVIKQEVQELL